MRVAAALGQQHTVITIDQALYCKLVELKWAFPEYQKKLVVLLKGGINVIGMTCTFTSIAKVIIYTHVNDVTAI